jgi:uncharacterized phiE125 gp8 family phage protein
MPLIVPPWRQPTSVYSVLVTPPTEEPITNEEAKLRAGVDWSAETDPREALVGPFIRAARTMVEQETGLALLTQARDIYFWPYDATCPLPLPMQATPLQEIVEIAEWEPSLEATPLMTAAVRPLSYVAPRAVSWTPTTTTQVGARMRIISGWESPAALAIAAPLLVHAVGLLAAHYLTLGRDLAITGAVAAISSTPEGYEACIAPHRLMWVA